MLSVKTSSLPPPSLSLSRGSGVAASPPTRCAAATHLPARIRACGKLRRRSLSLLDAAHSPGRCEIAGIAAAASAAFRRICTPPRLLRRPINGGAAIFEKPASGRIREVHGRAPARADSSPAWSTRPRRFRPPTTPR